MRPDDTAPDGAVLIPLRRRDGSVRAYAVVDAADADWVNQWRWSLNYNGYAVRTDRSEGRQRTIRLQRALLGLSEHDTHEADHIDRDRLNNRRRNLRALPAVSANRQNQSSHKGSTSQYRGVSWNARLGKWAAHVRIEGRSTYLGAFEREIDAAEAARKARHEHMPHAVD
jgi:hypothetical protein